MTFLKKMVKYLQMKITEGDIKYVSRLAKIKLKEEEIESYQKDLEEILVYVEKLKALPTENVKETAHILSAVNRFRKDVVGKELSQEAALANAPAKKNGYFKVPKIIQC